MQGSWWSWWGVVGSCPHANEIEVSMNENLAKPKDSDEACGSTRIHMKWTKAGQFGGIDWTEWPLLPNILNLGEANPSHLFSLDKPSSCWYFKGTWEKGWPTSLNIYKKEYRKEKYQWLYQLCSIAFCASYTKEGGRAKPRCTRVRAQSNQCAGFKPTSPCRRVGVGDSTCLVFTCLGNIFKRCLTHVALPYVMPLVS